MDLTEAEDIKKRWQEYTEELYKKDLQDQDNHDGMITHLEPDILECEVKQALESKPFSYSIKMSWGVCLSFVTTFYIYGFANGLTQTILLLHLSCGLNEINHFYCADHRS